MSIDALHALTLDTRNVESSVTVNQRALIDKVLSRYSSENTLLRELLQNSDDANATCVKIIYQSVDDLIDQSQRSTDVKHLNRSLTKRVVVKNNGQRFRPEDWTRLSRIAEGNPDEARIGAFGVGFYSVFSICEDPFVTSGQTGLAFYWRNDQLFTRTATLPTNDDWTTFSLNMRQVSEIPNLKSLTKFLATSLTFSRALTQIELWLDDQNLCTVTRMASDEKVSTIPKGLATTTSGRMLKITSVTVSSVQISASYLNETQTEPTANTAPSRFMSFFSSNKTSEVKTLDNKARTTSQIFLRVMTGSLSSSVDRAFSTELQRATKKPPPKTTRLQLVTVSAAEFAASTHRAPIFENLMTYPNQGRIYIGFPTHQTTGFAGHVGAPCIIPTVERESIDLVDRYIKIWNFEVLRAIGLLARIAYHTEFDFIKTLDDALHTIKFFSMKAATPQNVTQTVEQTFFESSNNLPIFSTHGVKSSTVVRLPDPNVQFLRQIPIVPQQLVQELPGFLERLTRLGYIESISIGDIKRDLRDRILSAEDATLFLKYVAKLATNIDALALSSLLGIALMSAGTQLTPINLGDITHFTSSKSIPESASLPRTCLPPALADRLSSVELKSLGWSELSIFEWLSFVVVDTQSKPCRRLETDPDYAIMVLSIVSKNFDTMGTEDRTRITTLLRDRSCMPTKNHGMQKPGQTYFHTIKMFDDLPLVMTMKGVKERFLVAIGVRKTIELNIIFDRLVSGGRWTAFDVIVYLASVRKDIPARDIERLKNTPLAESETNKVKQMVSQLYEPSNTLRLLGLPIIAWPKDKWKPHSEECNLVYALGLRRIPSVDVVLKIASTVEDSQLRERSLQYFITNYTINNYGADYNAQTTNFAFVPTERATLCRPRDVQSDPGCAIFGYDILRKDLFVHSSVLGVRRHPPVEALIQSVIQQSPKTYSLAVAQYSFIAKLQPTLSKSDLDAISQKEILPIEKNGKLLKMCQPRKCFFKQGNIDSLYHEIFDFIDFGPLGNQFLRMVGVRDEPSTTQIAGMLVNDAPNVWSICGSEQKYSSLLSQVARDSIVVKKDRHLWEAMRRTKFLLSYKYTVTQSSKKSMDFPTDLDDEDIVVLASLQKANDIVIVDDVIDFNMFRSYVYSCPQDQYLEDLYRELGSPPISGTIIDRPSVKGQLRSTDTTLGLRIEVLERLTVFLSESNTKPKRSITDLSSNLTVYTSDQISIQRDLRFGAIQISKHQRVTALTMHEGRKITLVVTNTPSKYDIAVALCKVVLATAKTGDYLLLETLLTNTLKTLKIRGYNVDRILQRHERERREKAQLQETEERQAIIDAEEAHKADVLRRAAEKSQKPTSPSTTNGLSHNTPNHSTKSIGSAMPGTFPATSKSSGLLSGIRKGLGIDKGRFESSPKVLGALSGSQHSSTEGSNDSSGLPISPATLQARPRPDQAVTSQQAINQTLQRAIKMTRNSDDRSVFSAGVTDQVAEAKSFCDSKPAQDLVLVATLATGMKFFANRQLNQDLILETHSPAAHQFSELLSQLGQVFNTNPGALNICYDDAGPTIAFNKNGTIYCNLRFYSQLHSQLPPQFRGEAITYWFVTLAHELAHNLVSEHSSEHEFYMESMIVQYMPRLMPLLATISGKP